MAGVGSGQAGAGSGEARAWTPGRLGVPESDVKKFGQSLELLLWTDQREAVAVSLGEAFGIKNSPFCHHYCDEDWTVHAEVAYRLEHYFPSRTTTANTDGSDDGSLGGLEGKLHLPDHVCAEDLRTKKTFLGKGNNLARALRMECRSGQERCAHLLDDAGVLREGDLAMNEALLLHLDTFYLVFFLWEGSSVSTQVEGRSATTEMLEGLSVVVFCNEYQMVVTRQDSEILIKNFSEEGERSMQGSHMQMDSEDDGGAGHDRRMLLEQQNVMPVKSIVIASLLFTAGTIFLCIAFYCLAVASKEDITYWWPGQSWYEPFGLFISLGLLCFLPGFYVVRLVFCILRGYDGYSWHDIPTAR
ncbi:hypothetical protein T484DRAFT_1909707 [Baffinella frigidus]|nr:hypothetical protein T484DRAFT_1909707 [Cryptophyta sp. CCMP2293]